MKRPTSTGTTRTLVPMLSQLIGEAASAVLVMYFTVLMVVDSRVSANGEGSTFWMQCMWWSFPFNITTAGFVGGLGRCEGSI